MAKLKSKMLVPSSGWHYIENGTLLKAGTFDDTVSLITKHRISNKIPLGDPARDLNDYTCARQSEICDKSSTEPRTPVIPSRNLIDQGAEFLGVYSAWASTGFETVDQVEANMRGDVCLNCPANQKVAEEESKAGCCGRKKTYTVLENVARSMVKALSWPAIRNKVTPADGGLYTCKACGCPNRVSIWLPMRVFKYSAEMLAKFTELSNGKCWKVR